MPIAGLAAHPSAPSHGCRAAAGIGQIAPAAQPTFTREVDRAADQSRQGSDLAPLQRFVAQWAVYVHIQRQPDVAADLRRWEDTAAWTPPAAGST
ncbi:hypothetical protein SSP24_33740 [Streptomyces spinoverrucosus]|uniref:Uncharacterized protein n=1 Tax=Streptomyces spinoverrucosus TaxID=284043 RepID=A0A4Y3VJF6_9ACTN|nr:hypothetical protein SSP24_33740 [Streptomyces spinoverrucosus]GHB83084.1 hypothetical protein GCM10010397_62960 [Streptomyces spinoverrucosus]